MRFSVPFLLVVEVLAAQTAASSFSVLSAQAQAARDADQLEKAAGLYKKALKLQPNWEEGLWSFAFISYDQNQYKDCVWAADKLSELKPGSTAGWTMAGLCQFELYNYGAALDAFSQVDRLGFAENAVLGRAGRLHFALVLIKTGKFEKAISVLTQIVRRDQNTSDVAVPAGIAGLRRPWLPAEVPESERDLIARLGDAMATGMTQDYAAANRKFDELLKVYPNQAEVHFRYGAMLYNQDPDRGIEEMKKAIALAPDHVPALVSMSAIELKRDDAKAAQKYGELAVKASPSDFATHVVLGRALLAADDPARAAAELEQAVKLAPNAADAHFSLATAYNRLGKRQDAAREQAEFKKLEQNLGGKQVP